MLKMVHPDVLQRLNKDNKDILVCPQCGTYAMYEHNPYKQRFCGFCFDKLPKSYEYQTGDFERGREIFERFGNG